MRKKPSIFLAALLSVVSAKADHTTALNPETVWGTWEGWGVSLCWWANVFGARDDLADLFFTTNYVSLDGQNLPGLGFNIARYNAGACGTNSFNGQAIRLSPKIPLFKQIAGYWLDGAQADPSSAGWMWNVDSNQRAMLLKAGARGANHLQLFSNSPMWWMCANHNPSGSENGTDDNLQASNYQAHAVYLATIAKYASDHWGVRFDSVEPFNEPVADWWKSAGTQEGCHFDPAAQSSVIGFLRAELDRRGLSSTVVAASDESYYDQAASTWGSFSATTRSQVGQVQVHGYQYHNSHREVLSQAVAGKRLWNSEYGDPDETGLSLATNLDLELRQLHPAAWCYWQALDGGGWGLIRSNPGKGWIGRPNSKFFVLAHYTRHIRPGMTIIDGGENNTVAAYEAASRKLVIVTVNHDNAQNIRYRLANFYAASGPVRAWTTVPGSGARYAEAVQPAVSNKAFSSFFEANSIQTFEVKNVDLNPPQKPGARRDSH